MYTTVLHAEHTLTLPNGDKLTGEYQGVENEQIKFKSPYLGDLTLDSTGVHIHDESGNSLYPSEMLSTDGDATAEKPLEPEWHNLVTTLGIPEKWDGNISLGINNMRGTSEKDRLHLESNVHMPYESNDLRWNAYYSYGKANLKKNIDKHGISLLLRHDFNQKTFFQSYTSYSVDQIKKIIYQLDGTLGLGHKIYDTEKLKLNLVPGLGAQKIEREFVDDEDNVTVANFYEDLMWEISDRVSFKQDFNIFAPPSDFNAFNFKFNSVLKTKLIGEYTLDLSYKYDFTNIVMNDVSKYTSTFITSIGYLF